MKRLALLALMLPTTASAGGFFFSDSGIVAMTRGGAWIAGADNQYAQRYNPAGLIKVERPTINLGMAGVSQKVTFDALAENGDSAGSVDNDAPPFVVPQLGFAMPIGEDFGFAFGMHSPFAPSYDYDPDGPQRYAVMETSIYQFQFGPSLAWRPHPVMTFGLGLNMQVFWVQESLKITTGGTTDPSGDVAIDLRVRDLFTPGVDFGLLVEPTEQLSFGLSMLPPTKYSAEGQVAIDFTGSSLESFLDTPNYQDGGCEVGAADPGCTSEDGVTLAIQLPMIIRTGLAVRPVEELEIEVAFVYQAWSSMQDLVVDDVDVEITTALGPQEVDPQFIIPQELKDTWSIRLGGQYRVHDLFEVRAGGFYEPSAVDTAHVTVSLVDSDKVQLGGGGAFYFNDEAFRFDFGGAVLLMNNLEVRDSQVKQTNAGVFNDDAEVVGNGDYTTSGWVVGAQASYAFGKRQRDEL